MKKIFWTLVPLIGWCGLVHSQPTAVCQCSNNAVTFCVGITGGGNCSDLTPALSSGVSVDLVATGAANSVNVCQQQLSAGQNICTLVVQGTFTCVNAVSGGPCGPSQATIAPTTP